LKPTPRLAALLGLLVAGCSFGAQPASTPARPAAEPPAFVYVAMGASETAGIGTARPERDSFPQQLLGQLARGAVLYDVGIPGETTAAALQDELPAALAQRPDLVTVFFNVDDLVAGVPPQDFQARLDQIVGSLRAGGHARVLVANTPPLDRLPAFASCEGGLPACPIKGAAIPSAAQLDALVGAYNAAIVQVVAARGATLVDLSAAGAAIASHPEYLAPDGFHPSTPGAVVLAQAFFSVWRSTH
jgi:lysophospholipase L1-like esterase